MKLEKLSYYPTPGYPTGKEFHELEKLTQYMPRRWRGKPLVGQILLLVTMTGLCTLSPDMVGDEDTDPSSTCSLPQPTDIADDAWARRLQLTEGDAAALLRERLHTPCRQPLPDRSAMPVWQSPEDWERAVAEYCALHPAFAEMTKEEALAWLARLIQAAWETEK